jgi:hypothetical protein
MATRIYQKEYYKYYQDDLDSVTVPVSNTVKKGAAINIKTGKPYDAGSDNEVEYGGVALYEVDTTDGEKTIDIVKPNAIACAIIEANQTITKGVPLGAGSADVGTMKKNVTAGSMVFGIALEDVTTGAGEEAFIPIQVQKYLLPA